MRVPSFLRQPARLYITLYISGRNKPGTRQEIDPQHEVSHGEFN